jgi:hypothetical protein
MGASLLPVLEAAPGPARGRLGDHGANVFGDVSRLAEPSRRVAGAVR